MPAPTASTASSTYYVATNGSDANPGSADRPWRTLARGASLAPDGAVIRVFSGTYAPFSISRSGLTFEPVLGASVTVSGGTSAIVITGSSTTIAGFRVTGATNQGIWVDSATNVVLRDLQVDHNIGHGAQIIRSTSPQVLDSVFASNGLGGLRELDNTTGGRYTGNTITDNGHDGKPYNGDGLLLQGSGAYVAANDIARNGDSATYEHGIYAAAIATGYTIVNNRLTGNAASGIKASGSGVVEGNTISGSVRGIVFSDDGGIVTVKGNSIDATTYAIVVTSTCNLSRYRSDYNTFVKKAFNLGGLLDLLTWRLLTGLDLHST
jgi:hypothetical protein